MKVFKEKTKKLYSKVFRRGKLNFLFAILYAILIAIPSMFLITKAIFGLSLNVALELAIALPVWILISAPSILWWTEADEDAEYVAY